MNRDSGLFSDELGQGVLRKFTNLGRVMADDVENSIRKAVLAGASQTEVDDGDKGASSSSERKYADEDLVGDDSYDDLEEDDDYDDEDEDEDDDDEELEDEWENDDDAGFILVPISEEEFFDLEEVGGVATGHHGSPRIPQPPPHAHPFPIPFPSPPLSRPPATARP